MKLPDAARQMGTPPNWLMYVGTPSVDDTAVRIAQLGGRVVKQPEDGRGRDRYGQRRQDHHRPDGSARRRLDRAGRRSAGRDVCGALVEAG